MFAAPAQFKLLLLVVLGAVHAASPQKLRNEIGKSGGIAMKKCEEYAKFVFREEESPALVPEMVTVDQCFDKGEALIVGGVEARPKEFPHMALIGYGNEDSIKYSCGGSLISPDFVLTAGHCLNTLDGPARMVLLGELDLSTETDDARPQRIEVNEIVQHPDYKPPLQYFDIGLLRLKHAANVTHGYVRPACLHTEQSPFPSPTKAVATGWGSIEYAGSKSDHLLKVDLRKQPFRPCNKSYQTDADKQRMPQGVVNATQLCYGDRQNPNDTCTGDSGGPLQFKTSNDSVNDPFYCMYHITGITSFGKLCGVNVPGVYTRVSYFVPWIESVVWPNEAGLNTTLPEATSRGGPTSPAA